MEEPEPLQNSTLETPVTQAKPKRKREAKLTPLIDAVPANEAGVTQTVSEAAQKPKKMRKPRKKKFVASKFDKTIAKLVVRGERSAQNIRDSLRVDADEFERELKRLCDEGLMVRGKFDDDYLSFTVKGFDLFASFFKKTLEKESEAAEAASAANNVVWDARQTLLKTEEEAREKERTAEKEKEKEKDALHKALAEDRALLSASLSEKKSDLDLEDAFKKGAPNCAGPQRQQQPKNACPPAQQKQKPKTGSAKESKESRKELEIEMQVDASAKTPAELKKAFEAEIAKAEKGAALRVGENEVCELCRAPFKIGGTTSHPKFGHCFCGAAYHKDCFETLADESEGKCVRCGKKLKLAMDARSEEAVKELKNVF